jgi:hypothetical protein
MEILLDKPRQVEMGKCAQKHVRQNFSIQAATEATLALYGKNELTA